MFVRKLDIAAWSAALFIIGFIAVVTGVGINVIVQVVGDLFKL